MKAIRSQNDLAINGAAPAFAEPLHVGKPNVANRDEFMRYAGDILDRGFLTNNGPLVRELEAAIADYHAVKHCVAMCNGTIALEIAIRALGLKGEVIVPSFTFIATAHALHWQEIVPVFADIDPESHLLDPDAVRAMITPKTTGIIAVHLWGRTSATGELMALAREFGLKLIFDAAHAFGCSYQGEKIGRFGECEVLSFHATKFFNTFEGGAVLTNNDELAEAMRLMRNFGFSGMDKVIHPGTNGKMSEISAAMGLANLMSLEDLISHNKRNHEIYQEELSDLDGINLLPYDDKERNNYQYIVLLVEDGFPLSRDELIKTLHAENILARRYFWPGCHKMKPYSELYPHAGLLLSVTEDVADKVMVLPTGMSVKEEHIRLIASVIRVCSRTS